MGYILDLLNNELQCLFWAQDMFVSTLSRLCLVWMQSNQRAAISYSVVRYDFCESCFWHRFWRAADPTPPTLLHSSMAERSKRSSKGKSISFVVVLLRDDGSTHPEYNITDDSKRRLSFFLHYDHMHFFPKPKYSLLYYLKRVALRRKADILRLSFN